MKWIKCIACLLISANLFSQSGVADKIMVLTKNMESDFNNNQMNKVSSYYLDSAVILGGGKSITGRDNLDYYWAELKDKAATWKLETDKVEDYDNIVIQRGRSYLTFSAERKSNVRFILIWKKTGNSYKVLYDSFTRL